jgi:steroid delta-isomerase-like uncharacterized protein
MASKNAEGVRAQLDAFNKGDLDKAAALYADDARIIDHAQGVTGKGPDEARAVLAEWKRAFSDAKVTDLHITEAGDTVIAQFTGGGTNDGPFGPFQATDRRMSVPFCNVLRFDDKGRIVSDELYYDLLSVLVQLGHAEAPAAS